MKRGKPMSPKTRERSRRSAIRRHAREKAERRAAPSDLAALKLADVRPAFRPLIAPARAANLAFYDALGGDAASPQRRALAADASALGLVARALMVRMMQSGDLELSTKLASVLSARRAALVAAGFGVAHKELELSQYVAQLEASKAQAEADQRNAPSIKPPRGLRDVVVGHAEDGEPNPLDDAEVDAT